MNYYEAEVEAERALNKSRILPSTPASMESNNSSREFILNNSKFAEKSWDWRIAMLG